jgi:hypothetical protein
MRAQEFITEQARAPLYHGTMVASAEKILQTNLLRAGPLYKWWSKEPGWWPDKNDPLYKIRQAQPRRGNDKFAYSKRRVLNPEDQAFVDWMNQQLRGDDSELMDLPMDEIDATMKKYNTLTAPIPGKEAKGVLSLSRNVRASQGFGPVIFVLDQDLLRRDIGRRIHPYVDDTHYLGTGNRDESEESVWGDITNFKKYILKVISKGPIDPEKFPLVAQAIKNTESVRVPGMPNDPRPYSEYWRPAKPQITAETVDIYRKFAS